MRSWFKRMRAAWRRRWNEPDELGIDRALVELALSLTREEWNARARTIAQSQGGNVHFGGGSEGTAAGNAAIRLEHESVGSLWIRPRFVDGRALPAAVEIVVSALPGLAVESSAGMDPRTRRVDTHS